MTQRRMAWLLVAAFCLGMAAAGGFAWILFGERGASTEETTTVARYHCPMHPTIVSDRPGDCPICGMRLVPVEHGGTAPGAPAPEGAPAGAAPAGKKKLLYRSTMNPGEVSDKPGKDSMGMDMVPEEIEEPAAPAGPPVEGRVPVRLSVQKRQLIGVTSEPVARGPLSRTIRTVGRVTYDETRLHHVHSKVEGYVERLYANATGELVRRGEPLLSIYSPELLASAQEFLLALRARDRLSGASASSVRESGEGLVESARRRLLLFDLTPGQIAGLEKTGEAPRTMTLYSPVTGHIVARMVLEGQKIESGMNLLDIANLDRVWVMADVYEYELPFVRIGQKATMTLSYLPGRAFEGTVSLIQPVLSEATRTVKVRIEFPNPDLALKPEMYADVELWSDLGTGLTVSNDAVISTGERDVVFVDLGEGQYEPREVRLGVRLDRSIQILEGLQEGDRVVTSGNFLLDSESKMKAAVGAAASRQEAAPQHVH